MSDNPFDRRIINSREKPVSEDINAMQSQLDRSLRFFAKSIFSNNAGAPQSGFFAGGFSVVESGPAAMSVVLKSGLGFQDDQTDVPGDINGVLGLDDLDSYKPLPLPADLTIPIPAAPAGPNTRIDIIEVRADRLVTDNQGREVFNITTEEFQNTLVDKTMEFLLDGTKLGSVNSPAPSVAPISLKVGIAANPGVAPAASPGYIVVAEVAVGSGVTSIIDANITDTRVVLQEAGLPARVTANENALYGVKTKIINASLCQKQDGGGGSAFYNSDTWFSDSGSTFHIGVPIGTFLDVGDRLLSVRLYCKDTVGNLINCELFVQAMPSGSPVSASDNVDTDNSGVAQSVDLTNISFNAATNIIEDDTKYFARVIRSVAPALIQFYGARITYETPQ